MRVLRLCSVYEAPPGSLRRSVDLDVVGGMQVHTARLTAGLDRLGVEQTVVTAHRRGALRVQPVGERSSVVRVGVPVRHFRQLYGLTAVREVPRHQDVDIVHVHLGEDLAVVPLARWAALRADAPLVVTVHCSVRRTLGHHDLRSVFLRSVGRPLHDRLFARASAVLVLSGGSAENLVASGLAPSRVRLVPLGIDVFANARGCVPVHERRSVLYVGRMVAEKGVVELLEAFARVARSDAELVLVGDGPLRRRLERAAGALAAGHRIRFVGVLPHPEVASYLARARCVVVPSWFEERGHVVLEAMANGAPVVATRTGGIAETVRQGVDGLLVPVRDPIALASAIARVLEDDALAASLSAAGLATAADHDIQRLLDTTLHTYETALAARHAGDPSMEVFRT